MNIVDEKSVIHDGQYRYIIKPVHISQIQVGDTIIHTDGLMRTVCKNNITHGFAGKGLFGDSYRLGMNLVKKVVFVCKKDGVYFTK